MGCCTVGDHRRKQRCARRCAITRRVTSCAGEDIASACHSYHQTLHGSLHPEEPGQCVCVSKRDMRCELVQLWPTHRNVTAAIDGVSALQLHSILAKAMLTSEVVCSSVSLVFTRKSAGTQGAIEDNRIAGLRTGV